MESQTLKEYVEKVYQLEVSLYEQQCLHGSIQKNIKSIEKVPFDPLKKQKTTWEHMLGNIAGVSICTVTGLVIGLILVVLLNISMAAGIAGGVLVGILAAVVYYSSDVKKENARNAELNKELELKNTQNKFVAEQELKIIGEGIEKVLDSQNETRRILEKYYDMNIIYPKYRNLVAVSSFHEYLASGRCAGLEGTDGAYNLYENEIRQDIIISKLDDIIRHLETIEKNQYMLYRAVKECTENAAKISQDVLRAVHQLQWIGSSVMFTEYNSRLTAQNTEYMKWLESAE